jgi:hypothetical protein
MTPYARKFVSDEEFELFLKIKDLVTKLPDLDLGLDGSRNKIDLSCHMFARAVADIFSLEFVDGYFTIGFQHSWVLTPNGHVIDVYPVAMLGGPILMEARGFSPARNCYLKMNKNRGYKVPSEEQWFKESVEKIKQKLLEIISAQL